MRKSWTINTFHANVCNIFHGSANINLGFIVPSWVLVQSSKARESQNV